MEGEFHGIDLLFAQKLSHDPQAQNLLARLLRSAREGELSLTLLPEEVSIAQKVLDNLLNKKIVLEGNRLYLQRHFALKSRFYSDLERIKRACIQKHTNETDLSDLSKEQQEAVIHCREQPFWLITGGPGTGKSFLLARLIRELSDKLSIVVTAPTGKAAARIREWVDEEKIPTMTLHRLLNIGKHYPVEKLNYDLILVDESSMVDITLFTKLLSCIKTGSRLILVGDHEQLPPVEGASYFRQLVEEESECTTVLSRSRRVEKEELLEYARKAKCGEPLPTYPLCRPQQLVESLEERVLFCEEDGMGKIADIKVLTPLRQGEYGVTALNQRFYERQKYRYPRGPVPIMINVNDEHLGIYNGDLGLLQGDEILLGGGRKFLRHRVRGYELAYVLSVHKSQGSEYNDVILILPPGSERFGNQMVYTAITRAKRQVAIYK
jgi:exodeoxyribonuclease V alpha subunit